jgi:hypothetical protein
MGKRDTGSNDRSGTRFGLKSQEQAHGRAGACAPLQLLRRAGILRLASAPAVKYAANAADLLFHGNLASNVKTAGKQVHELCQPINPD